MRLCCGILKRGLGPLFRCSIIILQIFEKVNIKNNQIKIFFFELFDNTCRFCRHIFPTIKKDGIKLPKIYIEILGKLENIDT